MDGQRQLKDATRMEMYHWAYYTLGPRRAAKFVYETRWDGDAMIKHFVPTGQESKEQVEPKVVEFFKTLLDVDEGNNKLIFTVVPTVMDLLYGGTMEWSDKLIPVTLASPVQVGTWLHEWLGQRWAIDKLTRLLCGWEVLSLNYDELIKLNGAVEHPVDRRVFGELMSMKTNWYCTPVHSFVKMSNITVNGLPSTSMAMAVQLSNETKTDGKQLKTLKYLPLDGALSTYADHLKLHNVGSKLIEARRIRHSQSQETKEQKRQRQLLEFCVYEMLLALTGILN